MHRMVVGCLLAVVVVGVPAYAQNTTTRVSVASGGGQSDNYSIEPSISADGRYVAFMSVASNLVPSDTNGRNDVFVHDRQTGVTERVSLGPMGAQATGGDSDSPSISADGRFVAFRSYATNLVPDDTNASPDIFVRDRQTATTTLVSVGAKVPPGNGASHAPAISADGRYVAFSSWASNLVVGDFNEKIDIFLRDRDAQTTVRVSVATSGAEANGYSTTPSLSANGRVVIFESDASNLVSDDSNAKYDVFARDLQTGKTTRVSVGSGNAQGNGESLSGTVSDDGRLVAFRSVATNLDTAGGKGIFVHDRQTGQTTPLSLVPAGTSATSVPAIPKISRDGGAVCYVQSFPAGRTDVFVADRETKAIATVSLSTTGGAVNGDSSNCAINGDGKMVAFWSNGSNLVTGDSNSGADVFVRVFPSTMALDKTALTFGAVTSGATFVSQTAAQIVRLTQDGSVPVAWTATSNQPWLQVSPSSGTGSATLSVSVAPSGGLPPSGTVTGTIFLSLTGAANTLNPIAVSLTLVSAGTTLSPFGSVDTPTNNRSGVTGAIPFTGWALDDIEVTQLSICRAAFGGEVPPVDPNCGGAAQIFVGFGVFIDGARPDVAAAFPTHPLATRAGWGFMVLTNMLPNQGNGTYSFTMRAQDREGTWVVLGTRTMTCANASATLPFGTLDTPLQGGVASGTSYVNFGWALTPLPKTIPTNGSTMHVLIDGVDIGTVDYNHARPDIQALFPGLNNTNGAVGFRILDTTKLTNGLHTISWTVTDDAGAIEGLGSRFFTVSNGVGAVIAAATATSPPDVDDVPLDTTPLAGRRGWDLEAPYGSFGAGASGVTVIRSEEVSRVELQLGEGDYTGYLRTPSGLAPLPIGSRLDPATNTLTWAPGVGFIGRYDFVFVRSLNGRAVSRRDVRIVLHPKGRGAVGPQVVIDTPTASAIVREPFMVGGWAVDLDAPEGTGVTTLHAWAFPASGGTPIFLGATAYGGARPDVEAIHGDRFKESGFGLIVQGLPAGDYDLAVFAWSTEVMGFVAPKIVRVSVVP